MKNILLLILILLVGNVSAYPITPQPLRKLIINSQNIIVGYVVQTGKNPNQRVAGWSGKVATVEILEVLKGENINDTIVVEYSPNLLSPEPARYYDSTYILAFLNRDSLGYVTQAFSYGLNSFELENKYKIDILTHRIKEMIEILNEPDEIEKTIKTVDWMVDCIENEVTRWDGMYELIPLYNFMSFYENDTVIDFYSYLDSTHFVRIKDVMFASDSLVYYDIGLYDLLNSKYHRPVNKWLIDKMLKLSEKNYWMAGNLMERINKYYKDGKLETIKFKYDEVGYADDFEKELDKIIRKYIKRLKQVVDE